MKEDEHQPEPFDRRGAYVGLIAYVIVLMMMVWAL